jgi:[NiFe] hydrogenase assembly HybE family chaperone
MTHDPESAALSTGLVRHFRHVARTRMNGVPIVNPAIQVEAVGFEHTAERCLGALITPWFINLILLPGAGEDWRDRPIGSVQQHQFASGSYPFRLACGEPFGRYQACSLLSPVLEIPDQQTAVRFARAALAALHDPQHKDTLSGTRAAEIERRWLDPAAPENGRDHAEDAPEARSEQTPLSRRAFLGGRLFDEPGEPG